LDIIKNYQVNQEKFNPKDKKQIEEILRNISSKDLEIINNPNKTLEDILKISEKTLLHPWLINQRLKFAKKIYDTTSTGKISLPTPTLLNARTNFHQLSSCFKLNIDDDLRAIFHGIENMAQISKY
jgi:ribonucleotide reductase alpha subunit